METNADGGGVVTTLTPGNLSEIMRATLTGLLVLLIGAGGIGLIVYYIVSKIKDELTLTLVLCMMGLGIILAALSVAAGAVYFVRRMGSALTEQSAQNQREMTGAFVQLVQETREARKQNDQLVSAMLRQINQSMPLQLTGSTKELRRFELGQFSDTDGDGKDDDDIVEVWVRQGNQYRKVEHSFTLLDDFIRMAQPSRELWQHENAKYGQTACIIEAIDGSPLERVGNSWRWRVPHDQVIAWWERAIKGQS